MTALSFDILGHDKASKEFDKVGKAADRTEKKFGFLAARSNGLTAGISAGFGKIVGAMAAVATVSVFKDFINEARESRKVGALTESIIKSTGGAAKISAAQVGDLATAISNKTGVDDEAVQSGANLLLTFKNVRNEVGKGANIFDRATQAAVDLSAAGFGDVNGASKMLGKALNDPLKGLTALGRAGVTFTADQQKQIKTLVKTGDILSAQKIILKEVESQVGGAAAASGDPIQKLGVIIGNVKETIGGALLPVVDKAATWLGGFLPVAVDKAGKVFGKVLMPPLQAAIGFITDHVGPGIQGLYDILVKHDFSAAFRKAFNVEEDAPIVGFLLNVGDGIEGLWKLLVKHDFTTEFRKAFNVDEDSPVVAFLLKINEGVRDAPAAAKKIATGLIDGLYDGFKSGDWSKLGGALGDGLKSGLKGLSSGVGELLDGIGALIDKIDWGKLGSKLNKSIHSLLTSIDWKGIGKSLGDAVVTLFEKAGDLGEKIRTAFKDLMAKVDWKQIGHDATDAIGQFITGIDWGKVAKTFGIYVLKSLNIQGDIATKVFKAAGDLVVGIQGTILKKVGEVFSGVGNWLLDKGRDLVGGLLRGAGDRASGVGTWFQTSVISPVTGAFSKAGTWLVQHGKDLLEGFKNGASTVAKGIGAWMMRAPVAAVTSPFVGAIRWLTGPGKDVISGLLNGIAGAAKGIGNWLGRNVISPTVSAFGKAGTWLVQHGRNLLAGFENGVTAIARGIGGWFSRTVISPVVGVFGKAGSWLVQHGKNLIAGLKNGASSGSSSIGRWIYDHTIVPIVRPFGKAGSWLVQHGKNLIAGLKNGVVDNMKNIGSWAKSQIVDPVVKAVKTFFGIKSPSKVFAEIGGHLVAGLFKGMGSGVGAAIARKVFGDMPSALRAIVGKGLVSINNLPEKALNALGSAVGVGQPIGGPSGNASNEGIVRTLAAQRGWTGAEWTALRSLIMGESGFRNTAQNPTSSAYGMFQFLDSTWGSVGASKTSDPWKQTLAGLTYIARSYGDPINAYAKWSSRSPHWYGNGGLIAEKVLGVGLSSGRKYGFGEHGSEVVTPMSKMPKAAGSSQVQISIAAGNSNPYTDFLISELRKYIRVNGGDVQVVLGRA